MSVSSITSILTRPKNYEPPINLRKTLVKLAKFSIQKDTSKSFFNGILFYTFVYFKSVIDFNSKIGRVTICPLMETL